MLILFRILFLLGLVKINPVLIEFRIVVSSMLDVIVVVVDAELYFRCQCFHCLVRADTVYLDTVLQMVLFFFRTLDAFCRALEAESFLYHLT